MPTLTYTLPYKVNSNLVMSPSELSDIYLFGIDFRDAYGNSYSDEQKAFHIAAAMDEIEGMLNIKLTPQVVVEEVDFKMPEFKNWGYMRTSFPVGEAYELSGFLGSTRQIQYPSEWLSARYSSDSPTGFERTVNLVPSGNSGVSYTSASATFSGLYPFIGYAENTIPNYWQLTYVTPCYSKIPPDIMSVIGKMASLGVLNVLGDIGSLGSGIASQSLSIDGLSQSASSTASATSAANTARILQYVKELDKDIPRLVDQYRGIPFSSL